MEFVLGELGTKNDETPMTVTRDGAFGATNGIETAMLLSDGITEVPPEGARKGLALG